MTVASKMEHRAAVLATALCLAFGLGGCDFFKELEDADSAGGDEDTDGDSDTEGFDTSGQDETSSDTDADTDTDGASEGDGGPCEITDEHCDDQDTVQTCDPGTGELRRVDCGLLCGRFVNLSCLAQNDGAHGCLCVEPGANKIDNCADLEACIAGCGDVQGACADNCFGRTTTDAVRIYGALVFCAQDGCKEICEETPEACTTCFAQAMQGTAAGCGVERALCDQDRTDDPFDP